MSIGRFRAVRTGSASVVGAGEKHCEPLAPATANEPEPLGPATRVGQGATIGAFVQAVAT